MSIEEAYRGGAPELITRFIFGRDGRAERRRFSHLASTGSIPGVFKMRGLWAGRSPSCIRSGGVTMPRHEQDDLTEAIPFAATVAARRRAERGSARLLEAAAGGTILSATQWAQL
jgi:hypothetical protein